jgi:four helix bundle protein
VSGCYKDLKAWQKSIDLTLEVYRSTERFPTAETYGLTSRMRRAAVSIASNIAEGQGKSSDGEFIVFLAHARESLHELETQALIAHELGHFQDGAAERFEDLTQEIGRILNGLIQSLTDHGRRTASRRT